jgi:integral membrane sensor domain MASE1
MNKVLPAILIIIAIGLIAYNVTLVDYSDPFKGESTVAVIGIVAALCAIILILIYNTSRKIKEKIDEDPS